MAAGLSVDLDRWRREFDELMLRVGGRFARVEPRRRMAAFMRGLLAGLPRVNCWSIAEHAGERCPRGMQRLLSSAVWDQDGMRDDLRGYVLEHFADPAAVLVVDETGDVKKGTATVGTQRQYTGTAGRTENAQVAVYLAYAAPAGSAFIDRALYLPRSWTSDPARCRSAGVPPDQRRRARVLPRPRAPPRPIGPARARDRVAVEGGGRVRGRQGTGRPGRAPGPVLDLLAPVDHPGPARPCLLVRPGQPGRRPP